MSFFGKSRLLVGLARIGCLLLMYGVTSIAQHQPLGPNSKESKTVTQDAQRLYNNSILALQHGNVGKARDGFERLVKMNPRSAEYRDLLGYVLMLQGDPKQAITILQNAVELDPKRCQTVAHLAEAKAQLGDLQSAVNTFQRAAKLGTFDAATHIAYAHALSGIGANDQAIFELETAIKMQPENPAAYDDLGAI